MSTRTLTGLLLFVLIAAPAVAAQHGHSGQPPAQQGGMMQDGMMQDHGMEKAPGMMGGMRMMMILADTDEDGALSLEEVQAVHARMFRAADADKDGKLTYEEMMAFMHGG